MKIIVISICVAVAAGGLFLAWWLAGDDDELD
jgi:hypothetical protein